MQSPQTPRYKLPLLAIGQAQKELFHNEALILLDFLIHPIVSAKHADLFFADVNETVVFRNGDWIYNGAIAGPVGGSTIDIEGRQVIESMLEALRIKSVITN